MAEKFQTTWTPEEIAEQSLPRSDLLLRRDGLFVQREDIPGFKAARTWFEAQFVTDAISFSGIRTRALPGIGPDNVKSANFTLISGQFVTPAQTEAMNIIGGGVDQQMLTVFDRSGNGIASLVTEPLRRAGLASEIQSTLRLHTQGDRKPLPQHHSEGYQTGFTVHHTAGKGLASHYQHEFDRLTDAEQFAVTAFDAPVWITDKAGDVILNRTHDPIVGEGSNVWRTRSTTTITAKAARILELEAGNPTERLMLKDTDGNVLHSVAIKAGLTDEQRHSWLVNTAIDSGVTFHRADLRDMRLNNVTFNGTDLSESRFDGVRMTASKIIKADLRTASFTNAVLTNTVVLDTPVDHQKLANAQLANVTIGSSSMYIKDTAHLNGPDPLSPSEQSSIKRLMEGDTTRAGNIETVRAVLSKSSLAQKTDVFIVMTADNKPMTDKDGFVFGTADLATAQRRARHANERLVTAGEPPPIIRVTLPQGAHALALDPLASPDSRTATILLRGDGLKPDYSSPAQFLNDGKSQYAIHSFQLANEPTAPTKPLAMAAPAAPPIQRTLDLARDRAADTLSRAGQRLEVVTHNQAIRQQRQTKDRNYDMGLL